MSTTVKDSKNNGNAEQEYAAEIKDITVSYRLYQQRPTSLKETLLRMLKERKIHYYTSFDALSGVSFKVPRGTIVGVIGSNGSGKSTLLKTLTGVLPPSRGKIITQGTIDSLIHLGSGFDSELNAVENIFLYGSLHNRPREETKERVSKILEFAELQEFAYTPVKYYSSGMFARLGFSCAIDIDPDLLLVDEVLAVGDERFNKKCKAEFKKFLDSNRTIIMVTHAISMIEKMAHQIVVLEKGKLIFFGDPKEAVEVYRDESYKSSLDGQRL